LSVDLQALLRAFSWARLVVGALLVVAGPWAPSFFIPMVSAGLLAAVLTVVVISSGSLLLLGPVSRPRFVAWLVCALDATLITAVVAATGGAQSILVFLYVPLVTVACLLLSRDGAVVIAGVASVLYGTLVLARSLVPVLAFGASADATTALDVLAILVNSGTLAVVAFVSGGVAERFLVSQRELASQRQSFSDLQAFSDVIFQSAGTGLVALDRAHRITAFNRAAETITGVPSVAALGARWSDVFGEALSLDVIETAMTGVSTAPTHHEIDLRRPDGIVAPVRVTASALVAGDGTQLGVIVACDDLSAFRALETRMRQADRLATLGRMAANIAHEIRNPLASLSGAVEALTRAEAPTEARIRLTEIVVRESGRLSEIIRNFLEYTRPSPLAVEPLDATAVLDAVLRALAPRLAERGSKVARDLPPALPLEADPERLRQAFWNLSLNAVAAMPTGGELRVAGAVVGGTVEISFTDTGEGILADELPHVFEPFFAARNDAAGLGLALVHRIAHEHGGEVTVRSERGFGAEFTLRFPQRHA
jgi:two-component system sensor histidine kinase PilS (NtrC family)